MGSLGVYFAITSERATALAEATGDDDALVEVVQEIEKLWDEEHLFQADKGWDAIYRALGDGTLDLCGLGGEMLNTEDSYFVVHMDLDEVRSAAARLAVFSESTLRERYFALDFPDYPGKNAEDWDYTWSCFQGLPDFFAKAARDGRDVIFTVDQ